VARKSVDEIVLAPVRFVGDDNDVAPIGQAGHIPCALTLTLSARRLCRNQQNQPRVMLSEAKHLAFSVD